MRTTVSLDDDVAAAVEEIRRTRRIGVSDAELGIRIDVSNVAEALDLLDGPGAR